VRFAGKFPLKFGGPDNLHDAEHQALLDALAPGWDTGSDTELYAETRADALLLTAIWRVNHRVANQWLPLRATDMLEDWERATSTRPADGDTLVDRRRRLAARLRVIANNAITDLEEAASTALGANFVALTTAAPADEIVYWPGINPGPPGYEWCTNRAIIAIHMNRIGLGDLDFQKKRAWLVEVLDHMRPAWLAYTVGEGTGVGTSFIVNKGICGLTFV
jgi:uncharacterized protein YmfQ (DUF2313 family)